MRWHGLLIGLLATAAASPLEAADKLLFGPAPSWIKPRTIPAPAPAAADSGPLTVLLADQQLDVEPGATRLYNLLAVRIDAPQGLSAGNISIPWNPETDTVTVHRLVIRRGATEIDVLKEQSFSTLRREANLEAAMLDGMLTANIQPEGLQVGDVIELAVTREHRDPVMKNHVEGMVADFNGQNLNQGYVRIQWPSSVPLKARASTGLPSFQVRKVGDRSEIEFAVTDLQPLVPPKGAPARFFIGRQLELSDFRSWSDLSELLLPHFRAAAVIPTSGSLREEVEKIRSSSASEVDRAEAALSLVQDRIRYVALLMGDGGYVPASAEQTWSRRFGDCKAKTALLIGILQELKIDAVPVLVNAGGGDGLDSRLPSAFLFNHVLVKARIGGRDYWLDGTRNGDGKLQNISVPEFRWGLPLATNANLIPIVPAPADRPTVEIAIKRDAREGVTLPAPTTIDMSFRGSEAVDLHNLLSSAAGAQREEVLRAIFKQKVEDFDVTDSRMTFDETTGELRLSGSGKAKIDWDDGYYYSKASRLGYDPDFKRTGTAFPDAPFTTNYPEYARETETIHLPPGFSTRPQPISDISVTIAGVEYRRHATLTENQFTVDATERAILPEVSYQAALADEKRLNELSKDWLSIRIPATYRETPKELAQLANETLTKPSELNRRGSKMLDAWKFDEAIADFTASLANEPDSSLALASRGIAYVWKGEKEKARHDLDAAEKLDPKEPVIFRAKGLLAQREGEWDQAISAYTTAIELDPDNNFSFGHRAEVYQSLGKDDLALADSEKALKRNPQWGELRLLRANIFLTRDQHDLAAKEADALLSGSPDSYRMVAAARIYAQLDRKADAMAAFDRAIATKPEAFIYLNRAQSRPFSDYAGRLADLDAALKLEPDNAAVLSEKAEQLAATGSLREALSLYDRVRKIEPDNGYLAVRRAILLYKNGATAEAEQILSERRKVAKTAPELNNLCWAKATAGILLESAQQDCQAALELKPDSGPTLDSLAFVKLRMNQFDEAIALYDQALSKRTGSASYMGRAIAYARKGEGKRAETDRIQARKLDPDAETRFAEYGVKF